jgi:hypothetical protein
MATLYEASIFRKLYAFVIIAQRASRNMSREYRYTLGAEMVRICWECLDLFMLSFYAPQSGKPEKISKLSFEFDRLNLRVRALQELKIISAGQFAHWQEKYLLEIGKEIGGWLKWSEGDNMK